MKHKSTAQALNLCAEEIFMPNMSVLTNTNMQTLSIETLKYKTIFNQEKCYTKVPWYFKIDFW